MKKVTKLIWALRGYFNLELSKKGQKSVEICLVLFVLSGSPFKRDSLVM